MGNKIGPWWVCLKRASWGWILKGCVSGGNCGFECGFDNAKIGVDKLVPNTTNPRLFTIPLYEPIPNRHHTSIMGIFLGWGWVCELLLGWFWLSDWLLMMMMVVGGWVGDILTSPYQTKPPLSSSSNTIHHSLIHHRVMDRGSYPYDPLHNCPKW